MRFLFIRAHERIFHVTTMCRVLQVSKAGFYKWRAQPLSERVKADAVLAARIRAIHTGRRRSYGSPRVHRDLRAAGVRCGEKRVARVMRQAGAAFTPSMSRAGDCWDNAVVESFFATLTKELLADGLFESRAIANRELFAFIEIWYNRQPRHSSLGYRSPAQFEAELSEVS